MPTRKMRCQLSPGPISRLLLLCLTLALLAGPSWAQVEPDFFSLQRAIAQLMNSTIARAESTRQSVIELRGRVDAFQKILEDARASTREYTDAVAYLATLLAAAAKEQNLAESKALVDDIRRDLDLKLQYYRDRLGVVGTARGLVKVTVKTLRQKEEVMGLVVHCNPYRWADDAKPMYPFPSVSSPTESSMLPGYYRCFASQGQPAKRIAWRDFSIGLDGSDAVKLDILIP